MDTTSKRLTEYTIDADTSVAVVGFKQLTELERSILPSDYETVDPFTEESFNYPPFRILDSPAAIVDAVLHTVTPENANDVAVVPMQPVSTHRSSSRRWKLQTFHITVVLASPTIRHTERSYNFRHAHAGRDTRVGDVRPLLVQLGLVVDIEHDEKRLRDLDVPEIEWLLEFSADIEAHTLASALDKFETVTGSSLDAFREELERLGIQDDIVTEQAVDRLEFYLQSYEVPIDRENDGVLLADAKSAAYVGRPVVFYLGLDEDWTHFRRAAPGSTATRSTSETSGNSSYCYRTASTSTTLFKIRQAGRLSPRVCTSRRSSTRSSSGSAISTRYSTLELPEPPTTGSGRNQSMWLLRK